MSDPNPPGEDLVGTVLNGKYQVQKRLSQGGMGVVYKARHLMLDAPVALKVLLKPDSRDAQQRFLSEARLASKIRHPNTVYISDFGVFEDGRAFLEMEYLDGPTLAAELERGRIEVLRACQIAVQMARGLQAVHDKGIIHRDMKPDNVFLMTQDGSRDFVKIVDFGVAKAAQRDTPPGPRLAMTRAEVEADTERLIANLTQHGAMVGTPGFMAPEQIQGLRVDSTVDQYALGCILYEMIVGVPVFVTDSTHALLMKHLRAAPVPPRERCPERKISKRLDALVLRLLAKEPAQRLASMRAVELALQTEVDRLLAARDPRPAQRFASSGARRVRLLGAELPYWAVVLPCVVLLLGASYGVVRWLVHRQQNDGLTSQQSRELRLLRQRAIQILRQDLRADMTELRYTALAALGQTGEAELRPELEQALSSADVQTRTQAAAALGMLGDRRAIPALAKLVLDDKPPSIAAPQDQPLRMAAAEALRQLGDPRGERFLQQVLASTDQDSQLRAALFFCAQGPADVKRVLSAYAQRSGLPDSTIINVLGCLARA